MNSTDVACSPPPREAGGKPSLRLRSPDADDKEKPTHIRFLLSNNAAGSIIGKGGLTISEFQSQSGARIQLSRNHEFFPGTSDRIIKISGELSELSRATELILEKLLNEAEENRDVNRTKVRLIIPNSSCGAIIGKGGSTIKYNSVYGRLSKNPKLTSRYLLKKNTYAGFHDRLVTVTGSLEEHMRAIILIMSKLLEDAHYTQSMNSPFSFDVGYMNLPATHTSTNYGPDGIRGKRTSIKHGTSSAKSLTEANGVQDNSTTLGVPDEHIGAVFGRRGRNIMEITQISGAKIKISDRGDFMSGTSDRKITITGIPEAIRTAEAMILQRVSG